MYKHEICLQVNRARDHFGLISVRGGFRICELRKLGMLETRNTFRFFGDHSVLYGLKIIFCLKFSYFIIRKYNLMVSYQCV